MDVAVRVVARDEETWKLSTERAPGDISFRRVHGYDTAWQHAASFSMIRSLCKRFVALDRMEQSALVINLF
jgi:hypothetical protein